MFTIQTAVPLAVSLARGGSVADAARAAGVGAVTAFRWLSLARDGDSRYAALADLARKPRRRKRASAFPRFEWPAAFRDLVTP
jgi:hypothetical protein